VPEGARLPDVFIIGAAKSGTTSLYRWLAAQPEVFDSPIKEPQTFARPEWRDFEWYARLYADAEDHEIVIDASPTYTLPTHTARSATAIAERCPDARIVYLVRHPLARLRSQYGFDRRKGKLTKPLAKVCTPPDDKYAGRSLYFRCLEPYIAAFPRDQICVVRFEDLVADDERGWKAVLEHIGLTSRPRPDFASTPTAERPRVSPLPRWLGQHRRVRRLIPVPRGSRRRAERLLRWTARGNRDLEAATAPIPDDVVQLIWDDAARLADWMGVPAPLWDEGWDGNGAPPHGTE
jgi:hypothetical protein